MYMCWYIDRYYLVTCVTFWWFHSQQGLIHAPRILCFGQDFTTFLCGILDTCTFRWTCTREWHFTLVCLALQKGVSDDNIIFNLPKLVDVGKSLRIMTTFLPFLGPNSQTNFPSQSEAYLDLQHLLLSEFSSSLTQLSTDPISIPLSWFQDLCLTSKVCRTFLMLGCAPVYRSW